MEAGAKELGEPDGHLRCLLVRKAGRDRRSARSGGANELTEALDRSHATGRSDAFAARAAWRAEAWWRRKRRALSSRRGFGAHGANLGWESSRFPVPPSVEVPVRFSGESLSWRQRHCSHCSRSQSRNPSDPGEPMNAPVSLTLDPSPQGEGSSFDRVPRQRFAGSRRRHRCPPLPEGEGRGENSPIPSSRFEPLQPRRDELRESHFRGSQGLVELGPPN